MLSCTEIIWKDGAVTASDEPAAHTRLAEHVKRRRLELALSVRQAATDAGLARNTWATLETGQRRTADSNYSGIERALRWAPGSVTRIIGGHDPIPADAPDLKPAVSSAEQALIRIMRSNLPDADKARIMQVLIREADAANRRINDLAESYISGATRPPAA